ncbi:MAG: molybdate ABC transporter permease subunit [Anaerolineales bacterium]|nr:molybdate ABC transporter permease subunit [Anaerolineae bacterium]PWB51631.1 MAG: molybdate ABC transporter permease subunit [Anaerolineales bacterium]
MRQEDFHTEKSPKSNRPGWEFILPSLLLVSLIGLPILALIWRSAGIKFFNYALSESALNALKLSLLTSMICVAITLVTGTPLAYVLAHWKFRGKALLDILVHLPIVLPPSLAGIALLLAFGREGLFGPWLNAVGINLPFTTAAVVIAQIFVSAPFLVLSARIGFAAIDPQLDEAANVEGASSWHIFQHIMIPMASRGILTGVILTWARALGEFGATLLFAGNLQGTTQTMPLAIYVGFEQDLGIAIVLSILLLIVSLILLILLRKLEFGSQ